MLESESVVKFYFEKWVSLKVDFFVTGVAEK